MEINIELINNWLYKRNIEEFKEMYKINYYAIWDEFTWYFISFDSSYFYKSLDDCNLQLGFFVPVYRTFSHSHVERTVRLIRS